MAKKRATERTVYEEYGYEDCWDIMKHHFETLPSFETFEYGYRKSMCSSPEEYAEQRIKALHG